MAIRYLAHVALVATFTAIAAAQKSTIIPDDISGGFRPRGDSLQVSYTDEAVNGFKDGTAFEKDAVAEEPTFALGDSSGISPSTLYTIVMIDTTCDNARTLHYARANFKNNFDITNIATDSDALLDYKAPGSLGETGDDRQYAFLMYTNPGRDEIDSLKLPADGENFDIKKFQDDNGLTDATAGVGMVVKLGGEADCGSDDANELPSSLPSPRPAKSTTVAASDTNAGPASTTQQTTTEDASNPESTTLPLPTATSGSGNDDDAVSSIPPSNTTEPVTTSTVFPSNSTGPSTSISTIILSSVGGAGSPTASADLPEQSGSAAMDKPAARGWTIAPLVVIAGLVL